MSVISSTLGTLIVAQRLGKPNDRPSTLMGVIAAQDFAFPESIVIALEEGQGL